MSILSIIHFILLGVVLPIVLSVIYSAKPVKNALNYKITKGAFYLLNAGAVMISFFTGNGTNAIASLTVSIAIFEGLPPILLSLLNAGKQKERQDK